MGFALAMVLALGLAGCAQVEKAVVEADRGLQEFFGTDDAASPSPGPPDSKDSDRRYREALAAAKAGNDGEALRKLRAAADAGHAAAAFELALAYSQGLGVQPDMRQADFWMDRAAELREPWALYLIGASYDIGGKKQRIPELAASYYAEAALLGHAVAQYQLAEAFAKGDGVEKNLSLALRWYGKAAHQGDARAQSSYGALMASGRGQPKDPQGGYGWLILADRAGVAEAAAPRQALAGKLSEADRKAAAAWAAAFRPGGGDELRDPSTARFVQILLLRLSYQPGPVDGIVGRQTAKAIGAFEADRGRRSTGRLSPQLLHDLLIASRRQAD